MRIASLIFLVQTVFAFPVDAANGSWVAEGRRMNWTIEVSRDWIGGSYTQIEKLERMSETPGMVAFFTRLKRHAIDLDVYLIQLSDGMDLSHNGNQSRIRSLTTIKFNVMEISDIGFNMVANDWPSICKADMRELEKDSNGKVTMVSFDSLYIGRQPARRVLYRVADTLKRCDVYMEEIKVLLPPNKVQMIDFSSDGVVFNERVRQFHTMLSTLTYSLPASEIVDRRPEQPPVSSSESNNKSSNKKKRVEGREYSWTSAISDGWIGGTYYEIAKRSEKIEDKALLEMLEIVKEEAKNADAVFYHLEDNWKLSQSIKKNGGARQETKIKTKVVKMQVENLLETAKAMGDVLQYKHPDETVSVLSVTEQSVDGKKSSEVVIKIAGQAKGVYYTVQVITEIGVGKYHVCEFLADETSYSDRVAEFRSFIRAMRY